MNVHFSISPDVIGSRLSSGLPSIVTSYGTRIRLGAFGSGNRLKQSGSCVVQSVFVVTHCQRQFLKACGYNCMHDLLLLQERFVVCLQ